MHRPLRYALLVRWKKVAAAAIPELDRKASLHEEAVRPSDWFVGMKVVASGVNLGD